MLLAATNLLSRWCRNVTVVLQPAIAHPVLGFGVRDLGEIIISLMRDADPFGAFQIASTGPAHSQIDLVIGDSDSGSPAPAKVFINAAGWLATISHHHPSELPRTSDQNVFGAIAAACLGVAQMFKIVVDTPTERFFRKGIFDVFCLKWTENESYASAQWPSDLNIGKILMVGAGSVGSSAAYCMRLAGLAGRIAIIDKDTVKIENFNRSPIFGRRTFGLAKSEAVAQLLRGSSLSPEPLALWWDELVKQRERTEFDFDVWLPLANEFDVRASMQHSVPPLMIHASTSSNWGVNHGRHVPGRDDCLADRFPVEVSTEGLICATGQVVTREAAIDAALPFSSLFAGLLISTDLVRAQLPEYPQVPNFALFDWYGTFETIQAWDRKPRPGCICTQQGRTFHERFNRETRYWPLFRFN